LVLAISRPKRYAYRQARKDSTPKGPRVERRPADVISRAVQIMKIATGEEAEDLGPVDDGKDPAAKAMGKKGGAARARSLTAELRQEIARKGAAKRWGKQQDG
jgi:hypothetical protein